MLRARDAMDRDYAQPLDIPRLAKIAYVSEAHFIRVFRATFGETPRRYLQRRRIERADVPPEGDRAPRHRDLLRRRILQSRHVQPNVHRDRRRATDDLSLARPRPQGRTGVLRVLDQDEALDFYVGKLGFEVNTDADLGFMRWLTVNFPGQPDQQLLLEKPGPPAHDEETAEQIRELVTKGALGMAAIIAVDDIHKTYEELLAKGVEFTEEPTERFYGTDCGLRDPFGNPLRMGTPKQGPIDIPKPDEVGAENWS